MRVEPSYGISALIEAPGSSPLCLLPALRGYNVGRWPSANPEVDSHQTQDLLASGSWTSQPQKLRERNYCLNCPDYIIFITGKAD